jgi:hypothetical protein
MERNQGRPTERARRFLEKAAGIHRENFADASDPLYLYSFPLYQTALGLLGAGVEVAWYLGPGDNGDGRIQRWRFEDEGALQRLLGERMRGLFGQREAQFAFEE